jgi:GH25 family lysozyme M1 (1,4-beta-N-acetylmuramidase)
VLLLPDLSEFQPHASLPAIKKMNGGAAILRAHNGERADYSFREHRASAVAAGFPSLGLYQYVVPSRGALVQAQEFCATIGRLSDGEYAILDIEDEGFPARSDLNVWVDAWCDAVDRTLGLFGKPLSSRSWVYSYPAFVAEHNLSGVFASQRRTWIADYEAFEPPIGHTLWQCTDGETGAHRTNWPGAGFCDTSVYDGDLEQFSELPETAGAPPVHRAGTVLMSWVTAGDGSLETLCDKDNLNQPVAQVIRLTLEHSPGGTFPPAIAGYVDEGDFTKLMDKGMRWYYLKENG